MAHSTEEAMAFFKRAHEGPASYSRMCLMLARLARDIGSLYYSAHAAQVATPQEHRVGWSGVKKGHVGYFGRPGDSNVFDHIATCAGYTSDRRRLWWTNDAIRSGGVDLVVDPSPTQSWFELHWGEPFIHGADWLNGVPFVVGREPSKWASGDVFVSKLHRGQNDSDSVRRLQYRLNQHDALNKDYPITGNYRNRTCELAQKWQRRVAEVGSNDGTDIGVVQAERLFGKAYRVHDDTSTKHDKGHGHGKPDKKHDKE